MADNLELRQVQRNASCRVCNKTIKRKDEKVVVFYSCSGGGGYTYICKKCVREMYYITKEK